MDMYSDIRVGFERTINSVGEESGTTELCVSIFTKIASNYNFSFSLDLITIPRTAGGLTIMSLCINTFVVLTCLTQT